MVSREDGLTLVEMMIVVIIIAVLVAIAVPVYAAATDNARKRTCQANLRTIDGAINQYAISNDHKFPTDIDQIKPYFKNNSVPKEPFDGSYELDSSVNGTWSKCSLGHEY